jgi:hypothetical protein
VPTASDLAYVGLAAGDVAEADVQANGTALQYTGLVLNGNGTNANAPHPFLKVQQQTGSGSFEFGACYLGNNSSAGGFGLVFFALSQQFNNAHMKATRSGSTVTIDFTNVNGGILPNQSYVCNGAPAPPGSSIGVNGYQDNTATLDNFGNGSVVLDTFSYMGSLASSGNWFDAQPGMRANGSRALGGPQALSFFTGNAQPTPVLNSITPTSGRREATVLVTLTGANFVPGFNTVQAGAGITVVRAPEGTSTTTVYQVRFIISGSAPLGIHMVTLTTPNGESNPLQFTVRADIQVVGQ